jgi:hypothetical protein
MLVLDAAKQPEDQVRQCVELLSRAPKLQRGFYLISDTTSQIRYFEFIIKSNL